MKYLTYTKTQYICIEWVNLGIHTTIFPQSSSQYFGEEKAEA
jgi:hypothetical protein